MKVCWTKICFVNFEIEFCDGKFAFEIYEWKTNKISNMSLQSIMFESSKCHWIIRKVDIAADKVS